MRSGERGAEGKAWLIPFGLAALALGLVFLFAGLTCLALSSGAWMADPFLSVVPGGSAGGAIDLKAASLLGLALLLGAALLVVAGIARAVGFSARRAWGRKRVALSVAFHGLCVASLAGAALALAAMVVAYAGYLPGRWADTEAWSALVDYASANAMMCLSALFEGSAGLSELWVAMALGFGAVSVAVALVGDVLVLVGCAGRSACDA